MLRGTASAARTAELLALPECGPHLLSWPVKSVRQEACIRAAHALREATTQPWWLRVGISADVIPNSIDVAELLTRYGLMIVASVVTPTKCYQRQRSVCLAYEGRSVAVP